PFAKEHQFSLEKSKKLSQHLLDLETEEILAQISSSAGTAWERLQADLVSKTSLRVTIDSEEKDYNIAQLKQLQSHAKAQVREQAYQTELDLLEQNQYSYAAAMNSIKSYVSTLAKNRNWDSALDEALFANSISQKSLTAMQEACLEAMPVFRNYYKAKAKILAKTKLDWFDILAPISTNNERKFSWPEAQDFIIENFGKYSSELADYAQQAFDKGWLDVPSRSGKRNGAFCMGIPGAKESRIMLNFGGSLDDVFTLAHELGHGYHNEQKYKAKLSIMQQATPMILAETASIFCETIVVNALLEEANDKERLAILEQDLLGSGQLVVDIYSRFYFENTVFNKRQERELSVNEFKEIMLDAQKQTYGDALGKKHPFMWANKGHYYSISRSYYNFPYTFGYLFGLGLYAAYKQNPNGFPEKYNKLLASTGLADAKTLAKDFDIDIEDKKFWQSSLKIAEARAQEYIKLVDKYY
ncbi:MAG TPA: oligoendopeptidase F, partial [Trueperaceae bacterium]|nr:oligoendopeptidase F [Trueperaceae bacterium]